MQICRQVRHVRVVIMSRLSCMGNYYVPYTYYVLYFTYILDPGEQGNRDTWMVLDP